MLTLAGRKTYHGLQCALRRRRKNLNVNEFSFAKNKNEKRNGNENGEMNVVGVAGLGVVASAGVEGVSWIPEVLDSYRKGFFGDIAWHGVRCGFGKGPRACFIFVYGSFANPAIPPLNLTQEYMNFSFHLYGVWSPQWHIWSRDAYCFTYFAYNRLIVL
jgi:hypothetical protein